MQTIQDASGIFSVITLGATLNKCTKSSYERTRWIHPQAGDILAIVAVPEHAKAIAMHIL